jgi:hypothetical protein
VIDAYGNPRIAAKYEAQIGAAMGKREYAAGHRAGLPKYAPEQKKRILSRRYNPAWAAPIIAALSPTIGRRMDHVMQATGLPRSSVQSVLYRMVDDGRVIIDETPVHQANLYRLAPDEDAPQL